MATGIAPPSKGKGWAPFPLQAATLAVSKLTPSLPSPRKMPKTAVALPRSPSHQRCSSCPWRCSCSDAACNGDTVCNAPYAAETWEDRTAAGRSGRRGGDGGTGSSGMPAATPWGNEALTTWRSASCILHHEVQCGADGGSCSLLESPRQKACARTSRVSSWHTTY